MKTSKRELTKGITLLCGFVVILVLLFSPVFNGQRPINYFDDLYNSISKGSVYYIPKLISEVDRYKGKSVTAPVGFLTKDQAYEMVRVYESAGVKASVNENDISVSGDLGGILALSLRDADNLFNNQGDKVFTRYQLDEKKVLYYWWLTLKGVEKKLTKEKRFEEAKYVNSVITRAVECSFNYYKVEPRQISTEVLFVVLSLLFYVVYTLWFGYAIMYIFIGLGLKLEH